MVKRVARAIAAAQPNGPGWRHHIPDARAAIEAMREPTEAMMEAADEPFHDELTKQRAYAFAHYGRPAYATGGFTERMWRAMITAALAEDEEG